MKFKDEIKRKDWYKSRELRTRVAQALNKFIENASPAVKARYRGGVTDGWLNYGKIGRKNWQRIEEVAAQIERSQLTNGIHAANLDTRGKSIA